MGEGPLDDVAAYTELYDKAVQEYLMGCPSVADADADAELLAHQARSARMPVGAAAASGNNNAGSQELEQLPAGFMLQMNMQYEDQGCGEGCTALSVGTQIDAGGASTEEVFTSYHPENINALNNALELDSLISWEAWEASSQPWEWQSLGLASSGYFYSNLNSQSHHGTQHWDANLQGRLQVYRERHRPQTREVSRATRFNIPDANNVTHYLSLLRGLADFDLQYVSISGKAEARGLQTWTFKAYKGTAGEEVNDSWQEVFRFLTDVSDDVSECKGVPNLILYALHGSSLAVANKAFIFATLQEKTEMLKCLNGRMLLLINSESGSVFLQQVLQDPCSNHVSAADSKEFQTLVATAFADGFPGKFPGNLCLHKYANFVVQQWIRFLQTMYESAEDQSAASSLALKHLSAIQAAICKDTQLVHVGENQRGVRIFQRLLERSFSSDQICKAFHTCSPDVLEVLMKAENGNFVMKQLWIGGDSGVKVRLLEDVFSNYVRWIQTKGVGVELYANHKYARHVLQCMFDTTDTGEVTAQQHKVISLVRFYFGCECEAIDTTAHDRLVSLAMQKWCDENIPGLQQPFPQKGRRSGRNKGPRKC